MALKKVKFTEHSSYVPITLDQIFEMSKIPELTFIQFLLQNLNIEVPKGKEAVFDNEHSFYSLAGVNSPNSLLFRVSTQFSLVDKKSKKNPEPKKNSNKKNTKKK